MTTGLTCVLAAAVVAVLPWAQSDATAKAAKAKRDLGVRGRVAGGRRRVTALRGAWLAWALLGAAAATAAPTEGQPAPALEARLLDGSTFALDAQRGKVVVVNLWATWCAPCRAEMAALDAYYRRHRDEGLVLVAISMDDAGDEAKVRQVMQTLAFPAALARNADMKGYGRVWRLPLTFVVGRDGTLVKSDWYGDPGFDVALLEATLTPLLRMP